jgi:outer membrane receptor protein involved in Fe transport
LTKAIRSIPLVGLAGAPVIAGAADEPPLELEEVVVTAQHRSETVLDVPFSMQAFSGESLEQTGVRDLDELMRYVPGASEGHGNTATTRTYQIRGLSSYYGDSTVGYYVDDAAFSVPNRNYAPVVDTFDMQRVEVLRGPQGTLYGLGSLGGTIRFITTDPDLQDWQARGVVGLSATDGGRGNYNGDLVLNAPLIADTLGLRICASDLHLGGYAQSPSYPGDVNEQETDNFRGKLYYEPVDALSLRFTYQHTEVHDQWGQNLASTDPPAFPVSSVLGRNHTRYDTYSASANLDTNPVLVQLTSGYIWRVDDGLGPFVGGPPPQARPVLAVAGRSNIFTQELRLLSNHTQSYDWLLGAIYQDGRNKETPQLGISVPAPPGVPLPPGTLLPVQVLDQTTTYSTRSYGIYGEGSLHLLNDRLEPLVGVRYFSDDRSFENTAIAPVPGTESAGRRFTATSPRFNVTWKVDDTARIYVNVAKGFRSGTFNTAAGIAAAQSLGLTSISQAVSPDKVWSYELGTKFTALDRRLEANIAVYRFKWSDEQLSFAVGPNQVEVIANAGNAVGRGVEYDFNWRASLEGLSLQAAGNFNRTTFENLRNPTTFAPTPAIADGSQVASVPKQTHTVGATFEHPLSVPPLSLYTNLAFTFLGRQGDPGDTGQPAFGIPGGRLGAEHRLLRARVGIAGHRLEAYLYGDNLLNDSGAIEVSNAGRTRYYPRVYGIEIRMRLPR